MENCSEPFCQQPDCKAVRQEKKEKAYGVKQRAKNTEQFGKVCICPTPTTFHVMRCPMWGTPKTQDEINEGHRR